MKYQPNAWSYEHVHQRDERFCAYVTCRQCGKTWTAAAEIDLGMTEPADGFGPPWVGVLAPTYEKAELLVTRYIDMVRSAFGTDYIQSNMNKHQAIIPSTGAKLTWISATNYESAQSWTFSKLIVDEAQAVPDRIWGVVYPTLAVREAPVRAFGTPDITPDQSWFKGLFLAGQLRDPDRYSYTLSCYENPWMVRRPEVIADARRSLPDRVFRMLWLGEWVDEEGAFFRNIERAYIEKAPEYVPGHSYVMAVDLAIHEDFNVVLIGERATRTVVFMDRWNRTNSTIETYDRIQELWEKWGRPKLVVDAAGPGGLAMADQLQERGLRPYYDKSFGQMGSRMEILTKLAGDIEHRRIQFPQWPPLVSELKSFLYRQTAGGHLSAAAASTFHDDCVTALALLNEHMRGGGSEGVTGNYLSGGNVWNTGRELVEDMKRRWQRGG